MKKNKKKINASHEHVDAYLVNHFNQLSNDHSLSFKHCFCCAKDLEKNDLALYVEESMSKIFCSQECIQQFFLPEVRQVNQQYSDRLISHGISEEKHSDFLALRSLTLSDPDEMWRMLTSQGEFRFHLISSFYLNQKDPFWCICICLCLHKKPSFLYLSFLTSSFELMNHYREGVSVSDRKDSLMSFFRKSQIVH